MPAVMPKLLGALGVSLFLFTASLFGGLFFEDSSTIDRFQLAIALIYPWPAETYGHYFARFGYAPKLEIFVMVQRGSAVFYLCANCRYRL